LLTPASKRATRATAQLAANQCSKHWGTFVNWIFICCQGKEEGLRFPTLRTAQGIFFFC
jgi:hypothetical protein